MKPLDPIALTRRLVDIESLTYNEGAVGEYLDTFLRERGFAVERTAVVSGDDLAVGLPGLRQCQIAGERDDTAQLGIELLTQFRSEELLGHAGEGHRGDGGPAADAEIGLKYDSGIAVAANGAPLRGSLRAAR